MKLIVQKFGGTSLSTPQARLSALGHIERTRKEGHQLVVVVSAMGRYPDPYSTDSLLKLLGPESRAKPKDLLMSCGEILSVAVMADLLLSHRIPVETLIFSQIGILTDDLYGDATILEIELSPILKKIETGSVVIVPGFQGTTKKNEVTTLGRGGSDTTAIALGAALKADLVEIYTDVNGVMTADPQVLSKASTISGMTFQEVGEMAYHGAKVLHPKSIYFAVAADLPVRIRSTFSPDSGTLISKNQVHFDQIVTGIAHIPNVAYVQIKLETKIKEDEARIKILKNFAEAGISLDFITVTHSLVCFIIQEPQVSKAEELLKEIGIEFQVEPGFAKVSVVGAGMRGRPGVMARIVESLFKAGVSLYHSTDSHITIACLVKGIDMKKAIGALHSEFITHD